MQLVVQGLGFFRADDSCEISDRSFADALEAFELLEQQLLGLRANTLNFI